MASARLMRRLLLFITVSILSRFSLSLPIKQHPFVQEVECDEVDTYTSEWFLGHTRPQYRQELHGKAIFYTKGASKYARALACGSKDYVSLWDIWPEWLYNDKDTPNNPLRCIHNSRRNQRRFYENMSNAFARMARKSATVMHLSVDYAYPPLDGIWGSIELPALRGKTDVTAMYKTNEDGSRSETWSIVDKGATSRIDKAIEEVQKIFRSAKDAWSGSADTYVDSCTLWASKEDGFLDSLW